MFGNPTKSLISTSAYSSKNSFYSKTRKYLFIGLQIMKLISSSTDQMTFDLGCANNYLFQLRGMKLFLASCDIVQIL